MKCTVEKNSVVYLRKDKMSNRIVLIKIFSGSHKQWRGQPDNLVPLCKLHSITIIHCFRNGLFSQSVNCEYLHSGTKSSGWLRYCTQTISIDVSLKLLQ